MIFQVSPTIEKTNSIPIQRKPTATNKPIINHSSRPHLPPSSIYRKQQQQNAIRIDTCIVGDDSTCDTAQNEVCKTDLGVSSCHCSPGILFLFRINYFAFVYLTSSERHPEKIANNSFTIGN